MGEKAANIDRREAHLILPLMLQISALPLPNGERVGVRG